MAACRGLQLCSQQRQAPGVCSGRRARPLASPHARLALRVSPAPQQRQQPSRAPPSAAPSAGSSVGDGGAAAAAPVAGRHAVLHDFCMSLPYGALLLAGALAARLVGWLRPSEVLLVMGCGQLALAGTALRCWRAGKPSAAVTLVQSALSGWLAYYAWRGVQQGVPRVAMGALLGLSAAMSAFLLYNVAAGGNPPRRGGAAA